MEGIGVQICNLEGGKYVVLQILPYLILKFHSFMSSPARVVGS